ncbi:7202_t:CDS:2 [Entrophospora sp. SA101]|nr:4610_t:CDS:2 [Entrophospora sp. SA101]CAJ0847428.1 7202_t:CDS:2 [Entrophospora sp. SA101]CAJ0893073.1 2366_t:CDS:2 [Entrophospora sp. SA101]CAJ0921166.1 2963_t:CDS:2 [Entrophospora sp. SA101]
MSEVLEDKLKKLIEESRASINWTEVNKWIAVGEPYEEHEEILMFMNQNGVADSRSDGDGRNDAIRGGEYPHGETFYRDSRKANQKAGTKSHSRTSTTTRSKKHQHCNKVAGSKHVSDSIEKHGTNVE